MTAISNDLLASINGTATSSSTTSSSTAAQDRFLTLLVAQLNNQDPMNPMDNAEMTSQIAQINTVTGIEKLNSTITGIAAQVAAMQALSSTSLIGRDVLVEGNALTVTDGVAKGTFDLAGKTTATKVDVVTPGGKVVGTVDLGAMTAGRQSFDWKVPSGVDSAGLTFKVTATSGTATVTATALERAKVTSVGTNDAGMTVQLLNHAEVPYTSVRAVL